MRISTFLAAGMTALALSASALPALAGTTLDTVIAARSDEDKARDKFRHPKETLTFFGLKSDMTVVEALPGGGWYTRVLLPYVHKKGAFAGAVYSVDMYKAMRPNASEEQIAGHMAFPERFKEQTAGYVDGPAKVTGYFFGSAPDSLDGTVDMVLFVRALHHLFRVEERKHLKIALAETLELLKPGGIVGVVQHRAPEEAPDAWAVGNAGYVKQSAVIAEFEAAGFEYVGASEVNANPKDKPTTDDVVWRLPPANRSGANDHIGESDRMTLKFRKPE